MSDAAVAFAPASTAERIVLGTAQIGLPYGRRKSAGVIPREHAVALLDAAWSAGIRSFDTAEAYGESAARLASSMCGTLMESPCSKGSQKTL